MFSTGLLGLLYSGAGGVRNWLSKVFRVRHWGTRRGDALMQKAEVDEGETVDLSRNARWST
jgi:hypothetical protein